MLHNPGIQPGHLSIEIPERLGIAVTELVESINQLASQDARLGLSTVHEPRAPFVIDDKALNISGSELAVLLEG